MNCGLLTPFVFELVHCSQTERDTLTFFPLALPILFFFLSFGVLVVFLFLLEVLSVYFCFWRWGWIRKNRLKRGFYISFSFTQCQHKVKVYSELQKWKIKLCFVTKHCEGEFMVWYLTPSVYAIHLVTLLPLWKCLRWNKIYNF